MALEELLRQKGLGEEQAAVRAETRDRGSLIRQAGEAFSLREEDFSLPEGGAEPEESVICADGYVRRSPAQPYVVPADYQKRRIRKAVTVAVVVCLAALALAALMKADLLRF
jgi:hypothetical protein